MSEIEFWLSRQDQNIQKPIFFLFFNWDQDFQKPFFSDTGIKTLKMPIPILRGLLIETRDATRDFAFTPFYTKMFQKC